MNANIYGLIYGQMIGDALGTRYEFKDRASVHEMIKQDRNNGFLDILGGGPFSLDSGQVTDDSELALGLLHSLLQHKTYSKHGAADKYIKWCNSKPFDIGNTTKMALKNSSSYEDCVGKASGSYSLSNGCLMRISPLALMGLTVNTETALRWCKEDCMITNPNPISINAVQVYCTALQVAMLTSDKCKVYSVALEIASEPLITHILLDARYRSGPTTTENGKYVTCDSNQQGYFGIALQNAFYELLNGNSFYNSMINIIGRGGDTDTNGCIAGALLGALYGKHEIPMRWIDAIKIKNWRYDSYPEVDQLNIDKYIEQMIKIIGDANKQ